MDLKSVYWIIFLIKGNVSLFLLTSKRLCCMVIVFEFSHEECNLLIRN